MARARGPGISEELFQDWGDGRACRSRESGGTRGLRRGLDWCNGPGGGAVRKVGGARKRGVCRGPDKREGLEDQKGQD